MTDEELERLLESLEKELAVDVQTELDAVAREFARGVDGATELVAAAFSVSSIRTMWQRRVPRIMTALRRITRRASGVVASDQGVPRPNRTEMNEALADYYEATETLLNAVGDRLAAEATRTLAEGVNAGETLPQLKRRLRTVFDDDGSQLGPVRSERIAQTEATRAFNAGTQAAAEAITGPQRPLVKQWLTRNDERVRHAHRDANGQIRLLSDPFDVGGTPMQYPGDPTAPADQTVNCRCIMKAVAPAQEGTASMGHPGLTASGEYTGAMVALVPSAADAARLAEYTDESEGQLHLTLVYLGEAADYDGGARESVINAMGAAADGLSPVTGRVFGLSLWNPDTDGPCWVWNVGDDRDAGQRQVLDDVRREVMFQLEDRHGECPDMPAQYTPWSPHISISYGDGPGTMAGAADGCGAVVFDRIRVGFGGEYTDFPLTGGSAEQAAEDGGAVHHHDVPAIATWSTPGGTALAFENQQTGDGRVFAPGALYWDEPGPWPLMANENFDGHDDAALAGAIASMYRDGGRIGADGLLYLSQEAGAQAAMLLAQGAPLGVSVDLDDVDVEMVDASGGTGDVYRARLLRASVVPTADGGCIVHGTSEHRATASGGSVVLEASTMTFVIGPDGTVPTGAFELEAAAGDPGTGGTVVDAMRTGDYLMRITRGRVRGATLVTIPAYADARIVLDDTSLFAPEMSAAARTGRGQSTDYERVLRHVRRSKAPVGAARAAQSLGIPVTAVKRILARAASRGEVVKLTMGLYTDATSSARADHVMDDDRLSDGISDAVAASMAASVTGAVDLPVADRDTPWDGDGAAEAVFEWADGDADRIAQAFAYRDDDADPLTKSAYKLGYADVMDGELVIIPRGVFAAQAAMEGARGGVDIPADERDAVARKLGAVRAHVDEETGSEGMNEMQASAWAAMADLPAMPSEWFREPTPEELPPGGPGVNYVNGRIFGWVAQADEPHAGYTKRIVINDLGRIDTTHFLRQRFTLDDGTVVKAGAFTMNAGHHRDGAECETSACQFDDTRTVAGIVTVGMNDRGMWFSGAAAPWMSEWDRSVFATCQPSYHMKQGPNGQWQLRAVLSVPVPGHSSPLLASAVVERAQLALTAAATMAEVEEVVAAAKADLAESRTADADATAGVLVQLDYDRLADALVASMAREAQRKADEAAELEALMAEAATMDLGDTGTEGK